VAEYDFSKYFDNISREYRWSIIRDNEFLVTPVEEAIIQAFLQAPTLNSVSFIYGIWGARRAIGLPQGSAPPCESQN
jgi:hypothetical protein